MVKKNKHLISISLVIILLLPMTIKLFDGLFHHHDHFKCTAKNEKHFHKYHEKCPIPNYELAFFSVEKHSQTTQKLEFGREQCKLYNFALYCNNSEYSFLLRAPPYFAKGLITS